VMRRVLLCMLEAVEGELCLLEELEVMLCSLLCTLEAVKVILCSLEAMLCILLCVEGGLCVREVSEVLEMMPVCYSVYWRLWMVGFVYGRRRRYCRWWRCRR